MDIKDFLKNSSLFQNLSHSSVDKLSSVCKSRKINKKEILFHEDEEGHLMYILAQGTIQLFKTSLGGRETVIKLINPGEVFAEVILFEESTYPVSARALLDSRVLHINRTDIHNLLKEENFRNDFIRALMMKQRYLAGKIHYLSSQDVEERFFRFLLEHYGRKEEYTISLSKKDMAAGIGTIPETFSRLTTRLEKEGKIEWDEDVLRVSHDVWDEL